MAHIPDDKFRLFISHKHEDHELATIVAKSLRSVSSSIECFVSGANIGAGTDWNQEIRGALKRSHVLILLFTNPSQNWDWCLYEAGLFTRLDEEDVHAVVSFFHPDGSAPRVLQNIQGVPASQSEVREFLESLCKSTWSVSDDWRKGPLNSRVRPEVLDDAAAQIEIAFPAARSEAAHHHPCHRLVLDLSGTSESKDGIPDDARVVEGPGATETYTLSLFQVASGARARTWGELVAALGGDDAPWRRQLDRRFMAALRGELFAPTTATLRAFALEPRHRRHYRPIIYEIVRAPSSTTAGAPSERPPLAVTIILDPQVAPAQMAGSALNLLRIHSRFAVEVFDVFNHTVVARSRSGPDVFDEVRDAFQIIDEEAERHCVFELGELEHVYGDAYRGSAIEELSDTWDSKRQQLHTALAAHDAGAVEALLEEMRELNRQSSLAATRRYLLTLEAV
ncbi:MAG: hypothetical protein QOE00_374 [Ilumatobacteraceae bacterium]|jgi:hypothetical protein